MEEMGLCGLYGGASKLAKIPGRRKAESGTLKSLGSGLCGGLPGGLPRTHNRRRRPVPHPRTLEKVERVYLRYFIAWFPLVILGLLNATIRQVVYASYVSELQAHQISTLTICVLVGIYAWILSGVWKLQSPSQAIGVGLMWIVLTVVFESGFGHYMVGDSWGSLLHAYDILEGRVWGLFVLWVGLAPYVFYRINS